MNIIRQQINNELDRGEMYQHKAVRKPCDDTTMPVTRRGVYILCSTHHAYMHHFDWHTIRIMCPAVVLPVSQKKNKIHIWIICTYNAVNIYSESFLRHYALIFAPQQQQYSNQFPRDNNNSKANAIKWSDFHVLSKL